MRPISAKEFGNTHRQTAVQRTLLQLPCRQHTGILKTFLAALCLFGPLLGKFDTALVLLEIRAQFHFKGFENGDVFIEPGNQTVYSDLRPIQQITLLRAVTLIAFDRFGKRVQQLAGRMGFGQEQATVEHGRFGVRHNQTRHQALGFFLEITLGHQHVEQHADQIDRVFVVLVDFDDIRCQTDLAGIAEHGRFQHGRQGQFVVGQRQSNSFGQNALHGR